jgi:hypothetical protein
VVSERLVGEGANIARVVRVRPGAVSRGGVSRSREVTHGPRARPVAFRVGIWAWEYYRYLDVTAREAELLFFLKKLRISIIANTVGFKRTLFHDWSMPLRYV